MDIKVKKERVTFIFFTYIKGHTEKNLVCKYMTELYFT